MTPDRSTANWKNEDKKEKYEGRAKWIWTMLLNNVNILWGHRYVELNDSNNIKGRIVVDEA